MILDFKQNLEFWEDKMTDMKEYYPFNSKDGLGRGKIVDKTLFDCRLIWLVKFLD